jgi:hypothetical protein
MNRQKRPLDGPTPPDGGGWIGLARAARCSCRAGRSRRLLWTAVFCLATAGCSLATPWSARQQTAVTRPSIAEREAKPKKSRFGSWFHRKEPTPPQSLREWMDLEPIRPELHVGANQ